MMASLATRETAQVVTRDGKPTLKAKNVVSAIASEFGAALRGVADQDYLRGAWNRRTMKDLRGTFEEHDWSEVLTGIYYELLEFLFPKIRAELIAENGAPRDLGKRQYYSMRALNRAATVTAGVMFRGIDYCPPVDLRYAEYARAVLRADEVAYPLDDFGIRRKLASIFMKRGLRRVSEDRTREQGIRAALRDKDIAEIASTPADAYRFLDAHRALFGIPYQANFMVQSVYRTKKKAKSGYRPPREHIIEFVWTEDVPLDGSGFGELAGTMMALQCGGTLVFDSNGNFLHLSLVVPTPQRRSELKRYVSYLVKSGSLAVADGLQGIGAPASRAYVRAAVENGRVRLMRNAAMRHRRHGDEP